VSLSIEVVVDAFYVLSLGSGFQSLHYKLRKKKHADADSFKSSRSNGAYCVQIGWVAILVVVN